MSFKSCPYVLLLFLGLEIVTNPVYPPLAIVYLFTQPNIAETDLVGSWIIRAGIGLRLV